ncbi:MMPL family protein [Rosistilla ulvae]|uniref:MMPL family protein n=1 Tax=Rosistilla ulvae TaxID=1930277 RepID=A0A517M3N1_9BACT|nr:MMPL family transporter [Rosistilla ulvae]QDS89482.1 MMPL family protein [Rosistilla ulvae]
MSESLPGVESEFTGSEAQQLRLRRLAWLVVAMLVALSPVLVYALLQLHSNTADMHQWLPEGRPEVQRYQEFIQRFGGDEIVVVSWPGCTLTDPRLPQLADALREAVANDPQPIWHSVITGADAMRELIQGPAKLRPGQAAGRIDRLLLGPDRKTTAVLIALTPAGGEQPHRVIDSITRIAKRACDLSRDQLRLAGGVYKASVIDHATDRSIQRCILPSALLTLIVVSLLLRSLRLTLVVLVAAVFCATIGIAMIHFTSDGINAILVAVPTLLYVLTVSGAVHLANYYRDGLREVGADQAGFRAVQVGWKPCALASLSTAIGMASLIVSDLSPIRNFGIYSALGVAIGFFVLMAVFAAVLTLSPCVRSLQSTAVAVEVNPWLDLVIGKVLKHHNVLLSLGLIGLALAGWGLSRTTTTVDLLKCFRPQSELVRNYRWINEHLGPQGSLEIVLYYDRQSALRPIDRLRQILAVEREAQQVDGVAATISALTFAPTIPRPVGFRGIAAQVAYEAKFDAARPEIIAQGWLAESDSGEAWRIHAQVAEIDGRPYTQLIAELRRRLEPLLKSPADGVRLEFTGGSPLIDEAQGELLGDLTNSFLLAFAILAPVMMLMLRSFWAGLLAMLPNVAPVVTVFGLLGWLQVPIGLGTMLTASVALGIAVDDTLHFLTWYGRAIDLGRSRCDAIRIAFHRCAIAMIQTTLICCVGMLVLVPAEFIPTSMFAVMMIVLLPTALVGDLVLLPALLASPIGKAFHRIPAENRSANN